MDWNWKDVAFKSLWTGVAAVLGSLVVWLADAPYAWAPIAIVAINALSAILRQRTGQTPPTLG